MMQELNIKIRIKFEVYERLAALLESRKWSVHACEYNLNFCNCNNEPTTDMQYEG